MSAAGRACGGWVGLGPVSGDESAVSAQHRCRDGTPGTSTVRVIERRAGQLPLQYQELMTQRQNLGIATIATGEQQTDASQHKANNERHRPKHDRGPCRRTVLGCGRSRSPTSSPSGGTCWLWINKKLSAIGLDCSQSVARTSVVRSWYDTAIPLADDLYDSYLEDLRNEGLI